MVPLDTADTSVVRARLGMPVAPGLLALRHALLFKRPGIWVDDPDAPRSMILVREGDGQIEAFGAGRPEPAVGWLTGQGRGFSLLAPKRWLGAVTDRVVDVDRDEVETWATRAPATPPRSGALTRRLTPGDLAAFSAVTPRWALRGWGTFAAMVAHGAAFGVPVGRDFVAIAWVFDQDDHYDALAVYTAPRYRRLGLGFAAARALVAHVVGRRGRIPLWSTRPDNEPSRALARALGLTPVATETLLRWPLSS